jgi:hypothetical protein
VLAGALPGLVAVAATGYLLSRAEPASRDADVQVSTESPQTGEQYWTPERERGAEPMPLLSPG